MDGRADGDDLFLLRDEKFDFDVSLSPASSSGDEDEVFVGPISHKERCASVGAPSCPEGGRGVRGSWSPLTGDQLEAVCQEALKLANQLQSSGDADATDAPSDPPTEREEFAQDADSKLSVLGQTARALSPVKRQTFCVQDSPMKQLPPAVQRHLLTRSNSKAAASTRPAAPAAPSGRPTSTARLSTSSPLARAKVQSRMALRGKAVPGIAVVLPSKPVAPTTSCSASKSRVEKSRLQPPSKSVGSQRQSPSSRLSRRADSNEDLLSDSASVASDISDSSINSSLLGKRALAPPTKTVGLRNLSGMKAPPLQSRRMTERKNTSSSSSSVSSFNSSMSLSPAKAGKLNPSLSSSTGPAPTKPASQSRPRRSTVYSAAEPASSTAGRRSLSTNAKRLSEAERLKAPRSTPLKRAEATPLQPTPAKKPCKSSITTTASGSLQSKLKAKPKPEALVLLTPSAGVRHNDGVPKLLKRLMSTSSIDSLPQKPSSGPQTPSAASGKSLQVKARRPSALPTPVKRRVSSIPAPTPTNKTRTFSSPAISQPVPTPSSVREQHSCSPVPKEAQEEEQIDAPDIQPFCLEEEEPLVAPPTNTELPDQSESMDPEALCKVSSTPSRNLIELETTEEKNSKTPEVLLLDLPAPTPQPQEKLLIDLTNTPNLIRTSSKTCTTTQQLIDLSSPLIKWSPDDKKESNAPLINLSF
ncbi:G2 and S phase-expressed protein 1 isoform X2 [Embiotoca jacksoni]|uniref:G2 and S phase-expressed protein 1 isoform X2 n=1 Tax=Embiotoca jacksoni TaxID=100190 RepID=UPI00370436BC